MDAIGFRRCSGETEKAAHSDLRKARSGFRSGNRCLLLFGAVDERSSLPPRSESPLPVKCLPEGWSLHADAGTRWQAEAQPVGGRPGCLLRTRQRRCLVCFKQSDFFSRNGAFVRERPHGRNRPGAGRSGIGPMPWPLACGRGYRYRQMRVNGDEGQNTRRRSDGNTLPQPGFAVEERRTDLRASVSHRLRSGCVKPPAVAGGFYPTRPMGCREIVCRERG